MEEIRLPSLIEEIGEKVRPHISLPSFTSEFDPQIVLQLADTVAGLNDANLKAQFLSWLDEGERMGAITPEVKQAASQVLEKRTPQIDADLKDLLGGIQVSAIKEIVGKGLKRELAQDPDALKTKDAILESLRYVTPEEVAEVLDRMGYLPDLSAWVEAFGSEETAKKEFGKAFLDKLARFHPAMIDNFSMAHILRSLATPPQKRQEFAKEGDFFGFRSLR